MQGADTIIHLLREGLLDEFLMFGVAMFTGGFLFGIYMLTRKTNL